MKGELLKKLLNILSELVESGFLYNKEIVLFGANAPATITINYFEKLGIDVNCIVDNNKSVQGNRYLDIEVASPEQILTPYKEGVVILIASRYYEDMKLQLNNLGYKNSQIIQTIDFEENINYDTSLQTFNYKVNKLLKAKEVFDKWEEKYKENFIAIVNPVKPNGDIYMIASYFQCYVEILKKELGKEIVPVLFNITKAADGIASLFDISNKEIITTEECDLLSLYSSYSNGKVRVINPYHRHIESYENRAYKKLTFINIVKHGLMNLPLNAQPTYPRFKKSYINLSNHKKVLLAPYSHSIPQIRWNYWVKLAEKLKEDGYEVYTNCSYDEPVVTGTKRVFFEFSEARDFIEKFDIVIAYRSGFCEIMATANNKRIVIYPKHNLAGLSIQEFFCMQDNIYNKQNLIEIVHKFESTETLLQVTLDECKK